MNRSRFLTTSFMLAILFLFVKIYQHNKVVKVLYQKQRVARAYEELEKKKNGLLVEFYKLKDFKIVRSRAEKQLGMKQLKPSQIVMVSSLDTMCTTTQGILEQGVSMRGDG